uniref:O-fucosyltransferase family protein n=1 Tax=Nelumbo nucifera TaxID=4432 RepID=A0A822ZXH3_NELNU|nr:TPA_asm: hypothetical protein HUJ06_019147 [Nelumbo nucifera]
MERDRDSPSSDEDDDHEALIDPTDTKSQRSTFEIGHLKTQLARPLRFSKRYLLAFCLMLSLIFLYFSVDFGNLFRSVSTMKIADSGTDRMREAELRALYLLKQQQLGLLSLWNATSIHSRSISVINPNSTLDIISNSTKNANSNSTLQMEDLIPSIEDFRYAVVNQIKLNKEIQEALLSSHRIGNLLELGDGNVVPEFGGYGFDRCRKVEPKSEERTIEWKPKGNKYLLAICVSGQMSNHLICLEKHMFFAAVLGRILVIPSARVDFQYNRVLDIDHINKCFGRKVVVSFEEFSEMKKNHLHIDRFICYVSSPQPCYVDDEHIKKLRALGITTGKLEAPWVEDIKEPKKRTFNDVLEKFSANDDVLAIGDVFFADVEQEWIMQPGGPLAHKCQTVIEPSRLIMLTAQRFIQTFLGKNFIALHFRRHGFLKFWADVPVIYLSTDAAESETDLLQSLIRLNGKAIPLVKRPARNSAEKWDALLYRHGLEGDSQVEAMLDKTICAMSSVFIGSAGSTFTEDILRLRKDWRSASICDEYLCQGEEPNFISDSE